MLSDMKKMKGDTMPGVISILTGLILFSLTLAEENMDVLVAKKRGSIPGPGFFPVFCAVFLVFFGALLILRGIRQNGAVDYFRMTDEMRRNVKTMALVVIGLVTFLVIWKLTSQFIPLIFAFSVNLNLLLFRRSLRFTLIFSVVITAFIYLLFVRGFSVTFKV